MPFKSKSQQRFLYAAEARGDVPKGTSARFSKETKSFSKLPEKKHPKETVKVSRRKYKGMF